MAVTAKAKLDAHTLRKDFPIFEQEFHGKPLAYLDSAASAQKPRQMLEAMQEFYETSYANVHRGVYELAERATEGLEAAREKVRALLNAPALREVIFVRNATEGINLVAYAWGLSNLGPGDVVLVTELEHHSNFVPWQYIAKRTGAEFRMIPLTDTGELVLDGLDELVGKAKLKVVALNLVSNALGTVNSVEADCGVGTRPWRDRRLRRRPGGAAPCGRCAGDRLRLPRRLGAQDVRPQRDRSRLGTV